VFSVIGARAGAKLTRRICVTTVVRLGLALQTVGLFWIAFRLSPHTTFLDLFIGFAFTGTGTGLSFSQLTSIVLWDIPRDRSGVASGANTTSRHVGGSLGVAVAGTIFGVLTVRRAVAHFSSGSLAPAIRDRVVAEVHQHGLGFVMPSDISPADAATVHHQLVASLASGARVALLVSAVVVLIGVATTFLIPSIAPVPVADAAAVEQVDTIEGVIEAFEPITPDPSLLGGDQLPAKEGTGWI
jgi:hypothetical protein